MKSDSFNCIQFCLKGICVYGAVYPSQAVRLQKGKGLKSLKVSDGYNELNALKPMDLTLQIKAFLEIQSKRDLETCHS